MGCSCDPGPGAEVGGPASGLLPASATSVVGKLTREVAPRKKPRQPEPPALPGAPAGAGAVEGAVGADADAVCCADGGVANAAGGLTGSCGRCGAVPMRTSTGVAAAAPLVALSPTEDDLAT